MPTVERIKRLLSIVILACLFMPLSQCTSKAPPNQEGGSHINVFVPVAEVEFKDLGEIIIAGTFIWPLAALAVRRRFRTPVPEITINAVEVLLCAGSLYWIIEIIWLWGEIRYGGVIALGAFTAYLIGACYVLLHHAKRKYV